MAKQQRSKDYSMNDLVGQRKPEPGTPKKFFGQVDKIATGKDENGDLIFADTKDPNKLGKASKRVSTLLNDKSSLDLEKKTTDYNSKVLELNPKYTSLIPLQHIIVRCFLLETVRTESGIIIPPKVIVDIPTNTGVGKKGEVESPFPFSRIAVIVAVPPSYKNNPDSPYKVGTRCMLDGSPLKATVQGDGVLFDLPSGFTHPEWDQLQFPTDFENEHFGYLKVSYRDIDLILPD